MANEVLRSSYMQDGNRIELVFDESKKTFRIGTRWLWIVGFNTIYEATDCFEALELTSLPVERTLGKMLKREIARVPRTRFGRKANSHSRIMYLVRSIENRSMGLRPQLCGSKGSVERWIESKPSMSASQIRK